MPLIEETIKRPRWLTYGGQCFYSSKGECHTNCRDTFGHYPRAAFYYGSENYKEFAKSIRFIEKFIGIKEEYYTKFHLAASSTNPVASIYIRVSPYWNTTLKFSFFTALVKTMSYAVDGNRMKSLYKSRSAIQIARWLSHNQYFQFQEATRQFLLGYTRPRLNNPQWVALSSQYFRVGALRSSPFIKPKKKSKYLK